MLKVYDHLDALLDDDTAKRFRDTAFKYLASDLMDDCGYRDENDLHRALLRSFEICCTMHIPISANFRKVFHYKDNLLQVDWQVSDLGCYLLLINGNTCNPNVARAQLSALRSASHQK